MNDKYVMLCTILYHLYNLKNMKNTHGGVLLFFSMGIFRVFQIVQMLPNRGRRHILYALWQVNHIFELYLSYIVDLMLLLDVTTDMTI